MTTAQRITRIAEATAPIYKKADPKRGIEKDCMNKRQRKRGQQKLVRERLQLLYPLKGDAMLEELEKVFETKGTFNDPVIDYTPII